MSQPRQVPTHSSSPSKSSLRRTSGGPQARSLLPSPHFEDDPIVASHQSPHQPHAIEYSEHALVEGGDESEQYGIHQDAEANAIPSFQPFFTLIEDSVTGEHHHPTVHYIFADDDVDIITEAACRSLEILDPSQRTGAQHHEDPRLPPPIAGVREQYLVLDVHPRFPTQGQDSVATPASYEVTAAQSFSADWQVLRSCITTAPTIGEGDDDALMLRIEGRGNTPSDNPATAYKESMEEMIERFQRRLEEIKQVMEATSPGEGQVEGAAPGSGVDE
ncbi:hypothetical protein PV08_01330 [Exophiala spinifera]|uniref:Uncharacterized protein n=1 Tax=Exophiala spinifera TaxID=91928 RepID=A0A0D2A7J2_9EURO|nr:uncharacterized protein PV08_01330 [Exophiala spinifera]KIW20752.1 hypothetical protein PV08_01330 [Exophiala spinifera]